MGCGASTQSVSPTPVVPPLTLPAAKESGNGATVDGRNPAPVEVGSLSHYLQGFVHPRCRISSTNSMTNGLVALMKHVENENEWYLVQKLFRYCQVLCTVYHVI